ncbi:hypothetical protein [Flavobacterium wongokense]|uniref:hypothetical protein n=1 Tax=Flavobacterium wongokense TaxID=2910674 RepID=UPI001F288EE3|nr:hypothetical protein [Flavobacterium sp. WG47]MCF6132531.1 hypothetical protein [Flavobacterium sp. WG47]
MHADWIIVGIVIVFGILLLIFLIRRNLKDEKDVVEHFNRKSSTFSEDDESETNDH